MLILGALMAACAQVNPAPKPTAVLAVASTNTPIPTPTSRPNPTATSLPTPTATATPALKQLTTGGCCVQPAWSPDSRQVLFIDKPSANQPVGLYAVDVITGALQPPQRVGPVAVYSQDRSLIAYLDKQKTVIEKLGTGEKWVIPNDGKSVSIAPDNQRLAWTDSEDSNTIPFDQRRSDVYIARVDGAEATRVIRLYGGGFAGWLPGAKILVSGRPSLNVRERTLSVLDLATRSSVNLITAERISGVSASNQGTWIAYYITFDADKSRNGIWIQRTDGSPPRKLNLWGAYQWRDDSHLLVIPMRDSSDRAFEVWEIDAATGTTRKLTEATTTPLQILNGDWRVSPDGRYIVYVNSADRNLWLLALQAKNSQ